MQHSSNSKSQEKAAVAELEDDQRLVASVVRAHLETCDFTSDKVAPTLARAREQPNYTLCHPTLVSSTYNLYYNSFRPLKYSSATLLKLDSTCAYFVTLFVHVPIIISSRKNLEVLVC